MLQHKVCTCNDLKRMDVLLSARLIDGEQHQYCEYVGKI